MEERAGGGVGEGVMVLLGVRGGGLQAVGGCIGVTARSAAAWGGVIAGDADRVLV